MHIEDFLDKSQIPFEIKVHLSNKTWIKTEGVCAYKQFMSEVFKVLEMEIEEIKKI